MELVQIVRENMMDKIEKEIELLGHGLSHVKGELLSVKNLIKQLNLQKESLEKEIVTIKAHIERIDNE